MHRQFSIQGLLLVTGGVAILLTLLGNGFGSVELMLLFLVCATLLIPGFLRQFRLRFGIGYNYSCPICSGRVSEKPVSYTHLTLPTTPYV